MSLSSRKMFIFCLLMGVAGQSFLASYQSSFEAIIPSPLTAFECKTELEWHGDSFSGEGKLSFLCGSQDFSLAVSLTRVRFKLSHLAIGHSPLVTPLGFGERLPSFETSPLPISVFRSGFRWQACFRRALVAFAFADLPPTEQFKSRWTDGTATEPKIANLALLSTSLSLTPPSLTRHLSLATPDWMSQALPDGSVAFSPKEPSAKPVVTLLPVTADGAPISDIMVNAEVQPNAAKSVGIGVCFEQDGGYVWRWRREGSETKLQLLLAKRSEEGWQTEVLGEEVLPLSPFSWYRLRLWRSGEQLWAGLDDEILVQVCDRRFAFGQISLWFEGGDRPLPLIRSLSVQPWWCASLTPSDETDAPFLALSGRWHIRTTEWTLQAETLSRRSSIVTRHSHAIALMGEAPLPSWWCVDLDWAGEPVGLICGWLSERHFGLLRLRPLSPTTRHSPLVASNAAVLELLAVRDGREQVLDSQVLWLERNATYRLALQMMRGRLIGFLNGVAIIRADILPVGKVGVWAAKKVKVRGFWLFTGEEPLLPLYLEGMAMVQPFTEQGMIDHESVAFTLPAGLPPNVPQSTKLSKLPITLVVERRRHRLWFRLLQDGNLISETMTTMPHTLPLTIRLERRERFLFVWLGDRLVLTMRW